jgi:hypothetical protein
LSLISLHLISSAEPNCLERCLDHQLDLQLLGFRQICGRGAQPQSQFASKVNHKRVKTFIAYVVAEVRQVPLEVDAQLSLRVIGVSDTPIVVVAAVAARLLSARVAERGNCNAHSSFGGRGGGSGNSRARHLSTGKLIGGAGL